MSPEILTRLNRKACCGKNHDGSYKLLDDASLNDDPRMCEACVQAKSRVKYGRPAYTVYKVPAELVGVDTFTVGYSGKPTLGGKRFCTVFVDYATRHVKIYLHKTKTQRLHMFRNYIGWAA